MQIGGAQAAHIAGRHVQQPSHLAARQNQKRIRKLRGTVTTSSANLKAIKKALAGNSY